MNYYDPVDFLATNWSSVFGKNATNKQINDALKYAHVYNPEAAMRMNYRRRYGRPPPWGSNVINLLQTTKKLPKTHVLPRSAQIVSFGKPKSAMNFTGRIQLKGTCWFQTIVNGWLLSKVGRKVIRERLRAFKRSSNFRRVTKNQLNACPSRKHIPQAFFWSYIEHMLDTKNWNTPFRANVMRGIEFPESKLVRSSGLRTANQKVSGGTEKDVFAFNDVLFTKHHPKYVKTLVFTNPKTPIPEKNLSHAYILYGNHAIAGYIGLDGKPMVYDSNEKSPRYIDWIRNPLSILSHLRFVYGGNSNSAFKIAATYVYPYRHSNAPSPNTRFFNKSKFNRNRAVRYNLSNYVRFFKNMYSPKDFKNVNTYKSLTSPKVPNDAIRLINYVNKGTNLRKKYKELMGKNAPKNLTNENIRLLLKVK